MIGDLIQQQVWLGYGIAGSVLGSPVTQSRRIDAINPVGIVISTTLPAAFDAVPAYKFGKPNLYSQAMWYALIDGSLIKVGDYLLTGSGDTYFVAALQHLLPIGCVQCNRVLTVLRPASPAGFGSVGYGGDDVANEVPVMVSWPASMLTKSRGERNDVGLPGDVRMPWFEVLFPAFPGVDVLYGDVITDDHGRRYKISSAELSDLGWRILAMLAMA